MSSKCIKYFYQSQLGITSCDVLLVGLERLDAISQSAPQHRAQSARARELGAIMRQRVLLRKLSPIAEHGFILPVGDWESSDINWVIIQVELQYGFITVVFVISCVETLSRLYHIISRYYNTLSYIDSRLNSTTFLYYCEAERYSVELQPPDGLDKHFSSHIRYLS